MATISASSLDHEEISRFAAQADQWWDPQGAFAALHQMGPLRMDYIKQQTARPLDGLRVLDVGCGGGLLSESLAREGAQLVSIDACAPALDVARAHAEAQELTIDYRLQTAEDLAQTGAQFDLIAAFEIVEHVADLRGFMAALATMLAPGGVIVMATVNRTKRSFLFGILAAEYLLGWVPPGTHDWERFVRPGEMVNLWADLGVEAFDCTGVVYRPLSRTFKFSKGQTAINYFMAGKKSASG